MSVLASYLGGVDARKSADNPMSAMAAPGMPSAPTETGNAFALAGQQLGMDEQAQGDALKEYLANGGVNLDPATTAWCAAFVNATLEQTGMKGTGSNMARSFLDWGQGVDQPTKGDLAVFTRGDPNGPYGHVGFFEGYNPDGTIRVLGGNQGNKVSIASYSADDLLGFRRGNPMSTYAGM